MTKADLEAKLAKHRADKALMVDTLTRIRQVARDCVPKSSTINNVWVIERVTETLTRIEP